MQASEHDSDKAESTLGLIRSKLYLCAVVLYLIPKQDSKSPSAESPQLASSSQLPAPQAGYIVDWYNENAISDKDLLDEYFRKNPGLLEQLSQLKSRKRKPKPDSSIIRDYRFALEVHKHLLEQVWQVRV